MTRAPAATRAYEGNATLSFGLVTIPIAVYTGTADAGIKRKEFTDEGHAVGRAMTDKETGEILTPDKVTRKIETEYGFVFVEDHEIEKLFEITPKTLAVQAFQPAALLATGQYVPKKPYYVEVAKTKVGTRKVPNKAGEQALALILEVMREEGAIAFVEFTTRGVPKPCVLTADGVLWELYYEDELREPRPLPEVELPAALVQQGKSLIQALWSDDAIDTTDKRSALIQAFADEKAQAGDFDKPAEVVAEAPAADTSNDLLAMLTASISAAKTA